MNFLKMRGTLSNCKPFKMLFRCAHVIADGRGRCNEHLDTKFQINLNNPEFPYAKLKRSTLKHYKFPTFCLKYSPEDCVQHAASVGIMESHPKADELLNKTSNNLQVLPSFPLTFGNKIFLGMGKDSVMHEDRTVHAGLLMTFFKPLKPHGKIWFKLNLVDIIDKRRAALYVYNMSGWDDDDNEMFSLEYQFYEMHSTVLDNEQDQCSTKNMKLERKRDSDYIFEFTTVPLSPNFYNLSSDDIRTSIFSPNFCKQYYAVTSAFNSEAICHGRYYLGVIVQRLLSHFANGDVRLFDRVKTKYTFPVFPGNTIVTKSWKAEERIYFEAFAKETGKQVLSASYLDLKKL